MVMGESEQEKKLAGRARDAPSSTDRLSTARTQNLAVME